MIYPQNRWNHKNRPSKYLCGDAGSLNGKNHIFLFVSPFFSDFMIAGVAHHRVNFYLATMSTSNFLKLTAEKVLVHIF
jgi:hypothetical protein